MEQEPRDVGEFLDRGLRIASRVMRRVAHASFALAAFALIIVGKIDTQLVDRARGLVAGLTAPLLDLASAPLAMAHNAFLDLDTLVWLREENRRLREENARLANLRWAAHQMRVENDGLRRLLRFDPGPDVRSISARIVADTGGLFARSVMVHVGHEHGVAVGMPVLGESGLVGRVQSVGGRAARILLISDLNSKVPVAVGDGRFRAIMVGTNQKLPRLQYFAINGSPSQGALIVTSGDGGVFYPGLPIGVAEQDESGGWRVRPFVDWNRLDYVRVVDFGEQPAVSLNAQNHSTQKGRFSEP